jgi:hypothetical protein
MTHLKIVGLVFILLISGACKKKTKEVNPSVIVSVCFKDKPFPYPTVYLKYGGMHNPQIPYSQYDEIKEGDEAGIVIFTNLPEDDYYIVAVGSPSAGITVTGIQTASMAKKESPNRYEKKITLN